MKKIVQSLLVSLCIICTFCSCGIPKNTSFEKKGYTVTDDKGNRISFIAKPARILTLALATDEILLDLVSPDRVIAVSSLSVDEGISTVSEKAKLVPHQMKNYEAEYILSCHPDLVIAPDWTGREMIDSLKDMGLPVYIVRGGLSADDARVSVEQISAAVGETEKGQKILEEMENDLKKAEKVKAGIPDNRKKTVVLYSHMKGYIGKGSLFDDLCQKAGVINGAAAIGMGKNDLLSKESLVKMNPDIILIPTWSNGDITPDSVRKELLSDASLQSVNAIRTGSLKQVPDKYIFSASPAMTKAVLGIQEAAYGDK